MIDSSLFDASGILSKSKKYNVISDIGDWSFRIQEYFYSDYYPNLKDATSFKDSDVLNEYRMIRKYFLNTYGNNGVCIDVGANIGFASIGLAKSGVHCVCFDPVAENICLLKQSAIDNNITELMDIRHCGLSNKNEERIIYVPNCSDNSSLDADISVVNLRNKGYYEENIILRVFDEISDINKDDIRMIKIDVQGFEQEVVGGMVSFLSQCKPNTSILLEIDDHILERRGKSATEIEMVMQSNGFVTDPCNNINNDKIFIKI